jgi:hypothetical protein
MNLPSKSRVFVGAAFAVTLPYVAFVVYFSFRLHQNNWPGWFINTLLLWFVANVIVMALVAKRIFKKQDTAEPDSTPQPSAKTKLAVWLVRIVTSWLVLYWSFLFIVGVKDTIQGKYALSRAVPAGAFLLFFIGLFGWSAYRSFRGKASGIDDRG